MQPSPRLLPAATRQRLLEAAARVFAREGLSGATTRAIAGEAGLNEVTLFRHFQTKDRLLAAVVGENFGAPPVGQRPPHPPTANLRADLLAYARRSEKLLRANLPLVRTMLGELHHHHHEHEQQVFQGVFRPLKAELVTRLAAAQRHGELRPAPRAAVLADLFSGMIFTGVLRRATCANTRVKLDYSESAYLQAAVELVIRGATATPGGRGI